MTAIDVQDVTKSYGRVRALDGLSLTVDDDTTFGLLGTNGAGKTTLLKLLVGLDTPDSGTITVAGESPTDGTRVRERVGYLPEHAGFPGSLTGREVLHFHARMRGVPSDERAHRVERVLHTVGLAEASDRAISGYSNGMNRRLGVGTMLVGEPAVLLLDEPTAGLDPAGIAAFHAIIERITAETDVTVVISGHALAEIDRLCDQVAIIDEGRLRRQGSVASLKQLAGGDVTVTATYMYADQAEEAAADAEAFDGVSEVGVTDSELELTCSRSRAYDVVAGLHDVSAPQSFEVRQPDLDAVFHDAIGDGEQAAASDGGESV